MAFDIQKALADGHSPAEISDYLGQRYGFNVAAARADGHSDADILQHLAQKQSDVTSLHENRLRSAQAAVAAEQQRAAPLSLGDKIGVGADLAAAGLSKAIVGGTVGGAAGLGARLTNQDPEAAKAWVDRNMVYHPQTAEGEGIAGDIQAGAGKVLAPVGDAISSADAAVGQYAGKGVQRVLRQTLGTAGDIASVIPGVAAGAEAAQLARAVKAAQEAKLASTPLEIAEASGNKALPSAVNNGTAVGDKPSLLARAAEIAGGSRELQASFIKSNLANSNDLAAQGIGLAPKTILTDAAIAKAKQPFAATYNQIRKYVPPAPLSQDTQAAIMAAGRGTNSKLELPANIQKIKDQLATGNVDWTSNEVLDTMSDLRNKATKDLMSSDSDIVARGHAQMDIARALENHLDEQLNGNRYLVTPEEFRDARTGFAKIYTVDNARHGYDVNPQEIANYGRETKLAKGQSANTGELAIIESNATHLPQTAEGKPLGPMEISPASKGGAIGRALLYGPRMGLRKAVSLTRGETTGIAARDNPALANFFQKDRPPARPDLQLTQSPGPVVEPHQPSLPELGDMSSPMAESTQNPRTVLGLQPPPGKVGMTPRQGVMDLGQGDDYLATAIPTVDEIIRKLRGE